VVGCGTDPEGLGPLRGNAVQVPASRAPFQLDPKEIMAAAAPKRPQLEALMAQFEPGQHKTRRQGGQDLTYVSIDATINRVNEVLGSGWSVLPSSSTQVMPLESGFLAKTELFIEATIDGTAKVLYGVGAMRNGDPDMAMKTALAEALKKAFHQAGVALYLWDPAQRDEVAAKSKWAGATLAAKKKEVQRLAKVKLDVEKPSAKQVAEAFGFTAADLAEDATIDAILKAEGLL
jgi:hypothetical protein